MKLRFPLYAKILFWFFLNLVVLAAIFYAFVKIQFQLGLDSLLVGRAGDRVQAMAELIVAELKDTPRPEWNSRLKNFGEAYKVQLYIFGNDGNQFAGETVTLPPEAREKLLQKRTPLPRPPGPPDSDSNSDGPPRTDTPPGEGRDRKPPPGAPRENGIPPGRNLDGPPSHQPPLIGIYSKFMVHTATTPQHYWVGVRLPLQEYRVRPPVSMVLMVASPSLRQSGLFFDLTPWLVAAGSCILCSVLFWIPLVRHITRSLSQLTHATERIAEGEFGIRVDTRRQDELGLLAIAVNRMASQLAGYVHGQKRFLGDVAHELCAPVARIQLALGILEQRVDPKNHAYVEDLREEVQHMSQLINELLSFSKAGLKPQEIKLGPVKLLDVARRIAAREAAHFPHLEIDVAEDHIAWAEPELLARAVGNIVRNGIRYAGKAGPITIRSRRQQNELILSVTDCGPGILAESLPKIFDPFYRPDISRNSETGGIGLGLAIVKTCVENCRGTVVARNLEPKGFQVSITLTAA